MPPTVGSARSPRPRRSGVRCSSRASTQQEVDRQITNAIAGAQADVAAASTRTSRGLVGALVGVIARDAVFNSPENGLSRWSKPTSRV